MFVPKGPIKIYPSIDSDNGFASSRGQAIVWTNDGYFTNTYMHHLASMDLKEHHFYG